MRVCDDGSFCPRSISPRKTARDLEQLATEVPPETWPILRAVAWIVLKYVIPAVGLSVAPFALMRLAQQLLSLYGRLGKRWQAYVREDPTIHGALEE